MTMHDVLRTSPYDGEAEQRESRIPTEEERGRVERLRDKLRGLDVPEIQSKSGQYYQETPLDRTSSGDLRFFVTDYGDSPKGDENLPRRAMIITLREDFVSEFSLHFGEEPDDPVRVSRVVKREGEAPSYHERNAQPSDFDVIDHALKRLEQQQAEAA